MLIQCLNCQKYFEPVRNRKLCSPECRVEHNRKKRRSKVQKNKTHLKSKLVSNDVLSLEMQEYNRKLISQNKACCHHCGYRDYTCSLEFHHLDPSQKSFEFGKLTKKQLSTLTCEEIECELNKCIVLCCNCHRALHYGLLRLAYS
jgi:hypothetical protein